MTKCALLYQVFFQSTEEQNQLEEIHTLKGTHILEVMECVLRDHWPLRKVQPP